MRHRFPKRCRSHARLSSPLHCTTQRHYAPYYTIFSPAWRPYVAKISRKIGKRVTDLCRPKPGFKTGY